MSGVPEIHLLIERKRTGGEHSRAEIERLINGFCAGSVDEDTFTGWLQAVMSSGMTLDETAWLTAAMANSGETICWDDVVGTVVDKHSTGGVGDAVSLIAVPLAAACGVKVAKLSGRALGHTGGTIDKLECIPGLTTALAVPAFKRQVGEVGCAIAAATERLAPADKKMYALRHRTKTIASIPLIAASVLSKKIAGGAPYLVIDVKAGRCAFMTTVEQARALAETIVAVASRLGRTVTALVTDMDTPLAWSVGDALELDEAMQVLAGHSTGRLYEVALAVAESMLAIRHPQDADRRARYQQVLRRALHDGSAYLRFVEMARAQGGDVAAFERPLQPAQVVQATRSGVVSAIDGRAIGEAVAAAQTVDRGCCVGVRLHKREGESVRAGNVLFEAFARTQTAQLVSRVVNAIAIGDEARAPGPPVIARLHAAAESSVKK